MFRQKNLLKFEDHFLRVKANLNQIFCSKIDIVNLRIERL